MPRQYFFWKYFNTIIVLYCIIVQKSPIFVQLSPIQCTHSNIFIRFFKFFPANTNIYQNSYRVIGANCAVEIALSGRQCSLLCLFAPFPHGYTVSRGVPVFSLAMTEYFVRKETASKTIKVFMWNSKQTE